MIYFFADDHYNVHPGKVIFEHLPDDRKSGIRFFENDWTVLESASWLNDCELLILNLIGTTCNLPHPGPGAEKAVRQWCEKGGNILMLHGSSAAFWQWEWWRTIVGFRWVRGNDPDGFPASFHPHEPYKVVRAKCRNPLVEKLIEMDLPQDEIYTGLEQTRPMWTLMTTTISSGTFPQCTESSTPWGGRVINFLPGHLPAVTRHVDFVANVKLLIDDLLARELRETESRKTNKRAPAFCRNPFFLLWRVTCGCGRPPRLRKRRGRRF